MGNIRVTLPQTPLLNVRDEANRRLVNNIYLGYFKRYSETRADQTVLMMGSFGAPDSVAYLNGGGDPNTMRLQLLSSAEYQALR